MAVLQETRDSSDLNPDFKQSEYKLGISLLYL